MYDMIQVAIDSDEDYLKQKTITRLPPTFDEIMKIISDANTDPYFDYIYEKNDEKLTELKKNPLIAIWIENNRENMDGTEFENKLGLYSIEGDFGEMIRGRSEDDLAETYDLICDLIEEAKTGLAISRDQTIDFDTIQPLLKKKY